MGEIELRDITKEFDTPQGKEIAVDDVSISIADDEFLCILGPSGCGKTTTLRCIAGLETPTAGSILFDGVDVTDVPTNKRDVAMVFQDLALYPHMTIEDNVSYPLKVRRVQKEQRYDRTKEVMELLHVGQLWGKNPGEVSGGQQQRVALARTIVYDSEVVLMDEPLSDLDAKLKEEIQVVIQQLHKKTDKPFVYVTHDQSEAMTMADRIALMNNGKIEQIGSPEDLYESPASLFAARFIGSPSMNFLEARVESIDGDTVIVDFLGNSHEFTVDVDRDVKENTPVVVGIRPERFQVGTNGGYFEAELTLRERTSDRFVLTMNGPDGELKATVPTSQKEEVGNRLSVSYDERGVYLFDKASERLVAKGTK